MRINRIVSLLMIIVLLLSCCACGKDDPAATGAAGKGRYMEAKVTLPLPEGAADQQLIGMYATENTVEYFTTFGEGDENSWNNYYYRHTVNGENVTTKSMDWLNDCAPQGGNQLMLTRGGDALYFTFNDYNAEGKSQNHIFVSHDDGKSGTELTGSGVSSLGMIVSIAPLDDGRMAVQDMDGSIMLLDESGNLESELGAGAYNGGITAYGNKLAYLEASGKAVCLYDVNSGESAQWPIEITGDGTAQMIFSQNGTLFFACPSGLYSHAPDGTLWERFVDGDTSNLGLPGYYLNGLALEDGERPVLYVSDYDANVYRYAYNPEAYQTADIELDVFSLNENYMVRQAVVSFNRSRSDVKVNYTVASALAGGGTAEDYIKALNTELLAGTGPDVIILDGLPVDSYIEKGVLAQIGSVVDGAQAMLPNVRKAYETDGALYAIPLGLTLPVVLAKEDSSAFASLDTLADAAEAASGMALLSPVGYSYETLPKMLLENYGDALNSGDPASVRAFLTDAGRLARAIGSSDNLGEGIDVLFGMSEAETREMLLENLFYPQLRAFVLGEASAAVLELKSLADYDSMTAAATVEQHGGTLLNIGGKFNAVGLAGLNKASENIETAEQFLQMLLSLDAQMVDVFNSDCFPVNLDALNEMFATENHAISSGTIIDESHEVTAEWPSPAMRAEFRRLVEGANTPNSSDEALTAMLLPEITAYLSGGTTLDEAVEKINSVLSTYLSE